MYLRCTWFLVAVGSICGAAGDEADAEVIAPLKFLRQGMCMPPDIFLYYMVPFYGTVILFTILRPSAVIVYQSSFFRTWYNSEPTIFPLSFLEGSS